MNFKRKVCNGCCRPRLHVDLLPPQIPHVNHMILHMWFTCGICGAHMCFTCIFMCISDKTCETHVFPCVPHVLHTKPHGIHMWNSWGTSVRAGEGGHNVEDGVTPPEGSKEWEGMDGGMAPGGPGKTLGVDEALTLLGSYGRWQMTFFVILSIGMMFPGCWHTLAYVFQGRGSQAAGTRSPTSFKQCLLS